MADRADRSSSDVAQVVLGEVSDQHRWPFTPGLAGQHRCRGGCLVGSRRGPPPKTKASDEANYRRGVAAVAFVRKEESPALERALLVLAAKPRRARGLLRGMLTDPDETYDC